MNTIRASVGSQDRSLPLNPPPSRPRDLFEEFLWCSYLQLEAKGAEISEALLPAATIAYWADRGIEVETRITLTRRQFRFEVFFEHDIDGLIEISVSRRKRGDVQLQVSVRGEIRSTHILPSTSYDAAPEFQRSIDDLI